ncbi:hypothetical protein [Urechidicola vernalis]|uniref:Uncharacterized protein n=1 Tax=Urechidicola vernalis TaxID=3075600 RepID=A0ABU2Y4B8_9FLAO|nr:hypothetical protein [Urechidicola sp. P050]MDT0553039.1 hypothetical protein [Urechidicola sp. P050]
MGHFFAALVILIIGLILFVWVRLSIKVAKMSEKWNVGYYFTLIVSLIFSPLIGWLSVIFSDKKDELLLSEQGSNETENIRKNDKGMDWVTIGVILVIILIVWWVLSMIFSFRT